MRNRKISGILSKVFITLAVIAFPLWGFTAHAENGREVVKVAFPYQDNLTEIDENDRYSGYTYEYLQKLSQYTNWKIVFDMPRRNEDINDSLERYMEELSKGEIDLIGGMLKTPGMEENFTYPENEYGVVYTTFCALETRSDITQYNFPVQHKVRVAVMKGATNRNLEAKNYLKTNGIAYEFIEYEGEAQQYQGLLEGQADVMISVTLHPIRGTKTVARFSPRPFFFLTTKGNTKLAQEVDMAINTLNKVSPTYTEELYEKYFGNASSNLTLTPSQREYVKNRQPVRIMVNTNMAPFCFEDTQGKVIGLGMDILKKISEMSGLNFEVVPVEGRSVSIEEALEKADCEMLLNVPSQEYLTHESTVPLSGSYFNVGMAHVFNEKSINKDKHDLVLALPYGSVACVHMRGAKVDHYPSTQSCMQAVNDGLADVTIINSYTAQYYIAQNALKNTKVIPALEVINGYSFAFRSPIDPELITIINACIRTIDGDTAYDMMVPYLTESLSQSNFTTFIKSNPEAVAAVALSFILLSILALTLIFYSRKTREQNVKLKEANGAKTDFMSRMSHDIRTPMNAVIGMANLGVEEAKDESSKEYFEKISSSGEYLLGLINDILDMSKAEAGHIQLNEEVEDMAAFLNDISHMLSPLLQAKNITLATDFSQAAAPYVYCDKLRVRQIYTNLLSNAVKFSPEGSTVEWTLSEVKVQGDRVYFKQQVRDYGIGISEEFISKIFQPFEQEHSSLNGAREGSGLGLAICKNLVEQMGGTISVESEQGKGSCFTVKMSHRISQNPPLNKEVSSVEQENFQGKTALLCEDHPLNTEIAKKLLEKRGIKVSCATNGKEAVEMFTTSPIGYYDVVLMDIRMPIMDGYQATRLIRSLEREDGKTVPIIAMTANAYETDRQLSAQAGMNMHLSKPIDAKVLYEAIAECIAQRGIEEIGEK
ncbi:MAG: transporter substrate-binding domain-containing protein [Oscillospiraceae bacterium]